ncbi:hypothetical protein DFJ74DRAFT_710446 [Hyaloraphidium curvatum]|nr:hypothetical protein DFJ74DRAFT_710446 [Hyaloraphidium curvatum]
MTPSQNHPAIFILCAALTLAAVATIATAAPVSLAPRDDANSTAPLFCSKTYYSEKNVTLWVTEYYQPEKRVFNVTLVGGGGGGSSPNARGGGGGSTNFYLTSAMGNTYAYWYAAGGHGGYWKGVNTTRYDGWDGEVVRLTNIRFGQSDTVTLNVGGGGGAASVGCTSKEPPPSSPQPESASSQPGCPIGAGAGGSGGYGGGGGGGSNDSGGQGGESAGPRIGGAPGGDGTAGTVQIGGNGEKKGSQGGYGIFGGPAVGAGGSGGGSGGGGGGGAQPGANTGGKGGDRGNTGAAAATNSPVSIPGLGSKDLGDSPGNGDPPPLAGKGGAGSHKNDDTIPVVGGNAGIAILTYWSPDGVNCPWG